MPPAAILRQPLAAVAAAVLLSEPLPGALAARSAVVDHEGGRDMFVHVPAKLPPEGARALVVVLHGGLGNAARIAGRQAESGLNLDAEADRDGFVVAYLNGTPVTRMGGQMLGWNAGGGCCGQSAANNIDDVAYISGAVAYLERKYGVDPRRVFAIGHSNGAMMAQRLVCETRLLAAAVAVSGPLNLDVSTCPDARGARILAIHGAADENVPIQGGRGRKGVSGVPFSSEARSERVMLESGASYTLQIVPGADHKLDDIDAALQRTEGETIAQKAARFFGIAAPAS
jgi:polyhydroxybutyrate depolymerase